MYKSSSVETILKISEIQRELSWLVTNFPEKVSLINFVKEQLRQIFQQSENLGDW